MKKYLNTQRYNSIWFYRSLCITAISIGVFLLFYSLISKDLFAFIMCFILFIISYLYSFLYLISYDSETIIVHGFLFEKVYPKGSFLSIRPLKKWMNLYVISFKDGGEYTFGVTSSTTFLTEKASHIAKELERDLLR